MIEAIVDKKLADKIKYWVSIILLIILLFISTWIVHSLFYPFKTVEFETPIQITNPGKIAEEGGELQIEVLYDKSRPGAGHIIIQLVDGYNITLSSEDSNLPAGKGKFARTLILPSRIPAGQYYLLMTIEYRINTLRTITRQFKSEPFMVFTRDDSTQTKKLYDIDKEVRDTNLLIQNVTKSLTLHRQAANDHRAVADAIQKMGMEQKALLERILIAVTKK
jgi:hypothetical protein